MEIFASFANFEFVSSEPERAYGFRCKPSVEEVSGSEMNDFRHVESGVS